METFIQVVVQVVDEMVMALSHLVSTDGAMWTAITLIAYGIGLTINRLCRGAPWAHPLLIATAIVVLVAEVGFGTIGVYRQNSTLIQWLLGPATVTLAFPLIRFWKQGIELGWTLVITLVTGAISAPLSAWLVVWIFNLTPAWQATVWVKSITTPLAMETAIALGGIAPVAAALVISTGIVVAIAGPLVFKWCQVSDERVQGVAFGTVGHAVGTAKAVNTSPTMGAMATLGLCINGIMTSLLLPIILG